MSVAIAAGSVQVASVVEGPGAGAPQPVADVVRVMAMRVRTGAHSTSGIGLYSRPALHGSNPRPQSTLTRPRPTGRPSSRPLPQRVHRVPHRPRYQPRQRRITPVPQRSPIVIHQLGREPVVPRRP